MITINYHPLVNAVVNSWRRSLACDQAGRPLRITQDDICDLVGRLATTIDILIRSYDAASRVATKLFEQGITDEPLNKPRVVVNGNGLQDGQASVVGTPIVRNFRPSEFQKFTSDDVALLICKADPYLASLIQKISPESSGGDGKPS